MIRLLAILFLVGCAHKQPVRKQHKSIDNKPMDSVSQRINEIGEEMKKP